MLANMRVAAWPAGCNLGGVSAFLHTTCLRLELARSAQHRLHCMV